MLAGFLDKSTDLIGYKAGHKGAWRQNILFEGDPLVSRDGLFHPSNLVFWLTHVTLPALWYGSIPYTIGSYALFNCFLKQLDMKHHK